MKKFNSWLMLIGVLCVIALVLFGFIKFGLWKDQQTNDEYTYNFFEFTPVGKYWATEIQIDNQPFFIQFHYHPKDVEDIPFDEKAKEYLVEKKPKQVFITLDPDEGSLPVLAGVEIAKITGTGKGILNLPTKSALTEPAYEGAETLLVTCDDANENITVIWVHAGVKTRVAAVDDCILVEGATPEDTIKAADRLAYGLVGII